MKVGDKVMSSKNAIAIQAGNRMPLRFIPTGMLIYDVELAVNGGGKICRSAGNSATLMALDGVKAQVKLPSGEIRLLSQDCSATIGVPSNPEAFNVRWGKAGRMRHRGIKPTVRGKVMNPVDHPHGGGEAKNSIGLKYPKTYTGKHALGVRTRKSKKYSNRLIVKRRSK
jgi:large subunit ribosomal protein L2